MKRIGMFGLGLVGLLALSAPAFAGGKGGTVAQKGAPTKQLIVAKGGGSPAQKGYQAPAQKGSRLKAAPPAMKGGKPGQKGN